MMQSAPTSGPFHSHFDWVAAHDSTARAVQGGFHAQLQAQPGKGKWDAVHAGFAIAQRRADHSGCASHHAAAEFANGSRLVYSMEDPAMSFLNFLGSKFFALSLSFVLGQPVKARLCGTKMLLCTSGETNLSRFRHGTLLFGMTWVGLWNLRCHPSVEPRRNAE